MAFILAKKLKMTQVWKENKVIPVTVVMADQNKVSLIRSKEKNGYEAVQIAMGNYRRESRIKNQESSLKVGDIIGVDIFKEGDVVRVSGTSKGRGFQGVVKRHGFAGGPKTHGQKNRFRAPGSIGSTAPQRVPKGLRMAGHMGTDRVTVKNLQVVGIDQENNLLFLKGAVPGARGGLLEISKK